MTLLWMLLFAQEQDALISKAVQDSAAKAAPSVVRIDLVGGSSDDAVARLASGPTTGTIVRADGLIATSAFGMSNKPTGVVVSLPDGSRKAGRILGVDHVLSIVLIKIDAANLKPIAPAAKKNLRVGQYAVAMGKVLSDQPSVSLGVVSALGRVWGKAVQTDAKTSPTNYGGPLINLAGECIGVLVPMSPQSEDESAGVDFYDSGIGFAVPMEDVLAVLPKLLKGDLQRGLVGLAWKKEDLLSSPASIEEVAWRSPMAKSGVKRGDRIHSVDGASIGRFADFRSALGRRYAGDRLTMEIDRKGVKQRVEMTAVAELPPYRRPFLGVAFSGSTAPWKIASVWPNSPALKLGVQVGDEWLELDRPMQTSADFDAVLATKESGEPFNLVYRRAGKIAKEKLVSGSFPTQLPSRPVPAAQAPPKTQTDAAGTVIRTQHQKPTEYWEIVPAKAAKPSEKPSWLIVWCGRPPSKSWESLAHRANAVIVGGLKQTTPFALPSWIQSNQSKHRLDRSRTLVVGPGPEAKATASQASAEIRGVVVLEGPFSASAPQPGDYQPHLYLLRPIGPPMIEAHEKAVRAGVPAVAEQAGTYEELMDAVVRWLPLMRTL